MESSHSSEDVRDQVKLTNPEKLYEVRDRYDNLIGYKTANGRQLFNHYRHNATNYDAVLDGVRRDDGRVSAWQQKQATQGAAEQILETFRDEHVKVIENSQKKSSVLKRIFDHAGVNTATAVTNLLDSMSEKLKDMASLENSQKQLRIWNDIYRVQYRLVQELIERDEAPQELIDKINALYSTRSVEKAVEKGAAFFNLEKSEILNLLKRVKAIRYPTAKIQKIL